MDDVFGTCVDAIGDVEAMVSGEWVSEFLEDGMVVRDGTTRDGNYNNWDEVIIS